MEHPSLELNDVPDFTLRKKYTKRPSSVIKMKLNIPLPKLSLPEDDTRRMWSMSEDGFFVVKTWQFDPLPSIHYLFKDCDIENICVEFNLGPHEKDVSTIKEMSTLNCKNFSLEFREHWAGLHIKGSEEPFALPQRKLSKDIQEKGQHPDIINDHEVDESFSDVFLKPFVEKENLRVKIRVLTGRISYHMLKELPFLYNLKFLGLRLNYDEYLNFTEVIPYFHTLERIHILPQWQYKSKLNIPPIRFLGVVTIYYWDLETTKSVKKAYSLWKRHQTKKKFLCW